MADEVAKLSRQVKRLEAVVELLVEHTGAGAKVADLEDKRSAERADRAAERNSAMGQATRDASAAMRRRL
jgi:hypothetical protein